MSSGMLLPAEAALSFTRYFLLAGVYLHVSGLANGHRYPRPQYGIKPEEMLTP
ncbi:MAG: hypothetical protein WKG07_33640 [Hymenobacter sp.]